MRRWLIWSAALFLSGLGVVGYNIWENGTWPEPKNAALAFIVIIISALLIPAKSEIPRIRKEREHREKELEDTFK